MSQQELDNRLLNAKNLSETLVALGLGADVNAQDAQTGETAAHRADREQAEAIVNTRKADLNVKDKDGKTPLMTAQDGRTTDVFLAGGADPYAVDNSNRNALFYANDATQSKKLLDAGINPNQKDKDGKTALMNIKEPQQFNVLKHYGAELNLLDNDGKSFLDHALKNPKLAEYVDFFKKQGARDGVQIKQEMEMVRDTLAKVRSMTKPEAAKTPEKAVHTKPVTHKVSPQTKGNFGKKDTPHTM